MVILRKPTAGIRQPALARFLRQARQAAGIHGRVNLVITSSREMRVLNRRFRGKDAPTDVLSFPAILTELDDFDGDIVIAADIAAANARRLGHPLAQEVKILALHGLLHLAGYDHETDKGQMARKEARLRRQLKLPEALIARSNASRPTTEQARRSAPQGSAAKLPPGGGRTRRSGAAARQP